MGPNNEGTSREEIVERMLGLLAEAVREGVELIAYPEMALTTYFPKKIRPDFDQFFETEVPPKALEPLLRRAAEARIAVHVGFCEKAEGKYFNTALLTDRDGRLCGTFRKIHLPGTKAPAGFAMIPKPQPWLSRPIRGRCSWPSERPMRRLSSSINSFKPGAVGDGSEAGHQWLAKESAGPLRTRKVRFRREPALRRVFIDCVREFAGQPREQLFSRQSCLFRQGVQHLRPDRLLKLGRRDRFIGARFNPRLGGFALTALRKAVQELTESAVQDPSGTGTGETPAQLTEQATDPTLPGTCGTTLPGTCRRILSESTEHFSDLVPVLVARDREQPQEGRHGWESAAHCVLLLMRIKGNR